MGVVKADQPFRRAEAKYALEGIHLSVVISGGALDVTKLEALEHRKWKARFLDCLCFRRDPGGLLSGRVSGAVR